eukprot:gene1335-2581_t
MEIDSGDIILDAQSSMSVESTSSGQLQHSFSIEVVPFDECGSDGPPTGFSHDSVHSNPEDISIVKYCDSTDSAANGFNENGEAIAWPQVVVNGVHKHSSQKDIQNFVNQLSLAYRKIKKVPNKEFCFISFNSEEERQEGLIKLNGTYFRNNRIEAICRTNHISVRDERTGRSNKRPNSNRNDNNNNDNDNSKKQRTGGSTTAREAVSPWADVPYTEQLERKTIEMNDAMKRLIQQLRLSFKEKSKGTPQSSKGNGGYSNRWNRGQKSVTPTKPVVDLTPTWLKGNIVDGQDTVTVPMDPIIQSPELIGYRNKCEFTFGWDSQSPPNPSVGFRLSGYSEGTTVGSPSDCPTVPKVMKLIVHVMTKFLSTSSLKPYDTNKHTGVWRLLTCRYSASTKDFLIMFCVSLREMKGSKEVQWMEELNRLKGILCNLRRHVSLYDEQSDFHSEDYEDAISVQSLNSLPNEEDRLVSGICLQVYDGLSVPHADHPVSLIFGKLDIEDRMLSTRFKVSPQAFFQVNTPTAELLFKYVIDALNEPTTDSATTVQPTTDNSNQKSSSTETSTASCVLDVCCGTGTIGLCYAMNDKIKLQHGENSNTLTSISTSTSKNTVIGIELCSVAVDDARKNAVLNGLDSVSRSPPLEPHNINATTTTTTADQPLSASVSVPSATTMEGESSMDTIVPSVTPPASETIAAATVITKTPQSTMFVCARAEAVLEGLLGRGGGRTSSIAEMEALRMCAANRRLLAVVDPPREGLHPDCLRAIRHCPRIQRLVYVSCNPTKSLIRDAGILCGPGSKRLLGRPFKPVRACPVDLFPMTPHCELVLILDRCNEDEEVVVDHESNNVEENNDKIGVEVEVGVSVDGGDCDFNDGNNVMILEGINPESVGEDNNVEVHDDSTERERYL